MLSVIITTYQRADRLRLCLTALSCQRGTEFEVLVVDDGSHDSTFDEFRRWADDTTIPAYYLWQQDTGFRLSAARNLGARAARGEAFVFIDVDVVLNRDAVANYERLLRQNPCRAIGGYYKLLPAMVILPPDIVEWTNLWNMTLPRTEEDKPNLGCDVRELHYMWRWIGEDLFRDENEVWRSPFSLLGGNLMIPRNVWDATEGFDERLTHYGGEDAEISIQIAQAGYGFSFSKAVAGGHIAHEKSKDIDSGTMEAIAYIKHKWPQWFPNGQPLWSQPGWRVPD